MSALVFQEPHISDSSRYIKYVVRSALSKAPRAPPLPSSENKCFPSSASLLHQSYLRLVTPSPHLPSLPLTHFPTVRPFLLSFLSFSLSFSLPFTSSLLDCCCRIEIHSGPKHVPRRPAVSSCRRHRLAKNLTAWRREAQLNGGADPRWW